VEPPAKDARSPQDSHKTSSTLSTLSLTVSSTVSVAGDATATLALPLEGGAAASAEPKQRRRLFARTGAASAGCPEQRTSPA